MLLSWPNPQSKHTEFHYVYSLFQVSVLLKGMLKDCTTELLLSLVANPISCSWPIPSFPEWNSLTGACVCVCPVTQGWPNPLSPVLVSQSVSQSVTRPFPGLRLRVPPSGDLEKSWHTSDEHSSLLRSLRPNGRSLQQGKKKRKFRGGEDVMRENKRYRKGACVEKKNKW